MMPAILRNNLAKAAGAGALALAVPLVAWYEGYRPSAYLDPVSIPTICYGHTATARMGQTRTREECDRLLAADLGEAFRALDRRVRVPLPDATRAALASWVYNVGEGAMASSTLLRLLNSGDIRAACEQLPRWVYAKGKQLPGLVARRAAERELCLAGVDGPPRVGAVS